MWYGAEVILLFFQESWLEALKTRVALQGLNHLLLGVHYHFVEAAWFLFLYNEGNKEVSWVRDLLNRVSFQFD